MWAQTTRNIVFSIVTLLLFISCSSDIESENRSQFDDIPITDISLISEFDQSGEHYFQFLNSNSMSLSNGDVILNDREGEFIILIDETGEFIRKVSRSGRGPGEVQDPLTVKPVDDSSILIFDQERNTVTRKTLDSSVIQEYHPPTSAPLQVSGASPTQNKDVITLLWWDPSFMMDENEESRTIFKSYDVETEEILHRADYPGETRARVFDDGRVVGAVLVPFVGDLLYNHSPIDHQLYVFWSDNSEIAVLDPIEFDTLRTIPVNLPSERLTNAERDSLQDEFRSNVWSTAEDKLPDQKTPAEEMLIDHQNRLWLKLTLRSEHQEWIVLNQDGEPEMRVQLPKEGILTHVSEHHIGFRADDHLFALYELVE